MSALDRVKADQLGLHFALNVFIASIIAWVSIRTFTDANPIWATASMIASSEPVPAKAVSNFRARLVNTLVGCLVGLGFLGLGPPDLWKMPFALAAAVLLSSYVVQIPVMWRQAPITAAIIVAGSIDAHSPLGGMELGLRRVAEVIFGCLVGVFVSWAMARLWPIGGRGTR